MMTVFEVLSDFFNRRTIRLKLISVFAIPIVLLMVLGIISYLSASNAVRSVAQQSAVATMENGGKYLDVVYSSIDDLSKQLLVKNDIRDYLSGTSDSNDPAAAAELYRNLSNDLLNVSSSNKYVSSIYLIGDGDKSVLPSGSKTPADFSIDSLKDLDLYKEIEKLKGRTVWLGSHKELDDKLGITGKSNSVTAIKEIISTTTGDLIGILIIDLKMSMVQELLDGMNLGSGGEVHLISPDKTDFASDGADNASDLVADQVFYSDIASNQDVNGSSEVNYKGKSCLMTYSKIGNSGYIIIGLMPTSELNASAKQIILTTVVFIILAVIISSGIGILMANSMSRTINRIIRASGQAASGDLTVNLSSGRQDELGDLTKSINSMISSMGGLIEQTSGIVNNVRENILISSDNLSELSGKIVEVSATTQEMSGVAEETAASTEEMNASSAEIESSVRSIAEKAQNGSVVVAEISKRAQDLKENAIASKNAAHGIRNDVDSEMRKALAQSKAVDNISVLTQTILQIADKTNLLSLNASIEAARAGEAGKGFAVVADEIRKLAEHSKNTVTKIHDVTMEVITSVENLASCSEKTLDFIDTKVINDYETMVGIGEQYYSDAASIQDLVTDFSATSEELLTSIQNMVKAINEVAISNSEEVQGIQNISQKALDVMERASKVSELMKETRQSSESLAESVSRFKI